MSPEVVLFIDGKHIDNRDFQVIPRVGDSIVIDCGEEVLVCEVSFQWDDPGVVQLNTATIKHEGPEEAQI